MLREIGTLELIGNYKFKPIVKEKTKLIISSLVLIRRDN